MLRADVLVLTGRQVMRICSEAFRTCTLAMIGAVNKRDDLKADDLLLSQEAVKELMRQVKILAWQPDVNSFPLSACPTLFVCYLSKVATSKEFHSSVF